jgi:hypothetical protein
LSIWGSTCSEAAIDRHVPVVTLAAVQLVKWQRNAIYEAIEAGGLDVSECTFTYDDAQARVTHVPSGSYFLLEGDPSHYTVTAVVGEDPPWPSEAYSWTKVAERVRRWAEDVKRDVGTPDLWAELQRARELLTDPRYEEVENTPFTSDEQTEIAAQLREIRQVAQTTYSLSDAEMRSLDARLGYLEAAAGRLGRTDWRGVFVGVIITVILAGLLPPEAVHHVFVTTLLGLEHLFGGDGVPLAPGQLPPGA